VRLIIYDKTCVRTRGRLTPVWATGAALYQSLGRIDARHGVASWSEAFAWLATQQEPITELQYWGHGKWGGASVGDERFDIGALRETHRLHAGLVGLRERLAPNALVWFRTCETLGALRGIEFAERLSEFLGARVAGHTFIVAFHQSGLHGVAPGVRADWSPDEGLDEGTPEQPVRAKWSRPWATRTITCLHGAVPPTWFAPATGS
jgi:hypothetical protein